MSACDAGSAGRARDLLAGTKGSSETGNGMTARCRRVVPREAGDLIPGPLAGAARLSRSFRPGLSRALRRRETASGGRSAKTQPLNTLRVPGAARIVVAHCKRDRADRHCLLPDAVCPGRRHETALGKVEDGADGRAPAQRARAEYGAGTITPRCGRGALISEVDAVGHFRRRDRLAAIAALLLPPAVCAGLVPLRATLTSADAALVLAVVAVAALGSRLAGYLATAGAAVWFDFFLSVPYERLALTRHADAQTTVLLVLVGVAATEFAVTAHRHGRRVAAIELAVAARGRSRVAQIDETLLAVVTSTATLVAEGEDARVVIAQVCVQLRAILDLQDCAFEPGLRRIRALRLERDGVLRRDAEVWPVERAGFPHETVDLAARHRGGIYGRFALVASPGAAPSIHARRTAVVLADLAAAALADDRSSALGP